MENEKPRTDESLIEARRKFLATCGRFALVTPPAVTLLLSAAKSNYAVAHSGGSHGNYGFGNGHGNNGFGNGGGDGVPGHSGFEDHDR